MKEQYEALQKVPIETFVDDWQDYYDAYYIKLTKSAIYSSDISYYIIETDDNGDDYVLSVNKDVTVDNFNIKVESGLYIPLYTGYTDSTIGLKDDLNKSYPNVQKVYTKGADNTYTEATFNTSLAKTVYNSTSTLYIKIELKCFNIKHYCISR